MEMFKNVRTTKYQLSLIVALIGCFVVSACNDSSTSGELGAAPTSENVTFESEPDGENPNVIHFTNTSDSFKAIWDFGNGATARGDTVTGEFPLKGEYTVTLTIFTKSGHAKNTQNITIEETNATMLDDPDLNMLTGGADNPDGKTWVIDSTKAGHLGVGPGPNAGEPESFSPDWYAAAPNEKTGKGLYDDEYTFTLEGFSYDQKTNGDIYVNGAYADEFDGAVQEEGGGDYIAPFEGGSNFNFVFSKEDDKKTLEITGGGHIGYYSSSRTYEILALSENELYIRSLDDDGSDAWYQRLIPKGYEHPPIELPYKSERLEDNFDEQGNVNWIKDQITDFNESYDNPAPIVSDTTNKVAKYAKGEGQDHFYDNVYIDLGYDIDLNERSTFKLKAYLPSYNDYTTEDPNAPSWSPYKSLAKQVSVKLQDTQIDQPFQTQEEIIQTVDETGTWVMLEFDFSGVSDREDFDRIVIQIGGEAHGMPGVFFIDDFVFTADN